jgi:hypothetical protein
MRRPSSLRVSVSQSRQLPPDATVTADSVTGCNHQTVRSMQLIGLVPLGVKIELLLSHNSATPRTGLRISHVATVQLRGVTPGRDRIPRQRAARGSEAGAPLAIIHNAIREVSVPSLRRQEPTQSLSIHSSPGRILSVLGRRTAPSWYGRTLPRFWTFRFA